MRAAIITGLVLAIAGGSFAVAQSKADFRTQARCLADYEAAATAVESSGGDKALIKKLDGAREKTALALATRRDLGAGDDPSAVQDAEAAKVKGLGRDRLVALAEACDKTLGY